MIERNTFIEFGKAQDLPIDYLIGIMEDARVTTLQRVHNLMPDELHWQYKEGWNTIGVLLSHIIATEHFFRIDFVEGRELNAAELEQWLPGQEMGQYIPQLITGEPIEGYIEKLSQSRAQMLAAIKQISKEEFYKKREGYNPKTGYNLAWALYHLAEDEVHHRGQISILRKLYSVR